MQSNTGRALVALAALALVVAAFFVIGGDDEAGQGSADPTTPTTADTTAEKSSKGDEPVREPEPELPTVELVDGVPADEVLDLEFDKGDQVEFAFTSDADAKLHVHGYDLYPKVKAGETEKVSFPAELDGIYEIENHANAALVAELRGNP